MAFNNYPQAYQPVYPYPQQYNIPQQQQQQNNMQSNMIWVSGEAGAKAYQVAPNTTVQLWDSEAKKIYLKSADASGMPSIKTLVYEIEESTPVNAPDSPRIDFATKDDILSIQEQINDLRGKLEKERSYERKPNANGKQLTK